MIDSPPPDDILNTETINALRDSLDDETVQQLMSSLLDEINNTMAFIADARAENRWSDIEVRVHGLKSAALGLGAETLGNTAAICEKSSRAVVRGEGPEADYDRDFEILKQAADHTLSAVSRFVA